MPLAEPMNTCRILVDSFADKGLTNAQMSNAREIIRRLDPERFQVTTFHVSEPDETIAKRPNTSLIRLPQRRQTPRIFKQFLSGSQDIVFYVKASPAAKWYLKLRRRWNDKRVAIGTVESRSDLRDQPTIASQAVRLWEQTILRSDLLFSNSQAVRQNLEHEYGLRSEVVPTGVDTNFFSPAWDRAGNRRPRVLFVGALRNLKEPDTVLDSAGRFPHAEFVMVGEGPMEPELRHRIKRERLANVQLTGAMGSDDLKRQYQSADIFLFPSAWEGSPKVILEAAATGLPVIARKNYEPESVVDGVTGFLVGSNDDMFDRLATLLSSADLRRVQGSAGRKHSLRFDWDLVTRQWEEIFLNLRTRKRTCCTQ